MSSVRRRLFARNNVKGPYDKFVLGLTPLL
jgi:hypothetical protein